MSQSEVGQSPDEVFDVVDARDVVVGQEFRREIHRRGLLHRAIHIFWLRGDGQLCLQRRSYAKDNCPGLLSSSCAGHVDSCQAVGQAGAESHPYLSTARLACRRAGFSPRQSSLVGTRACQGPYRPAFAHFASAEVPVGYPG